MNMDNVNKWLMLAANLGVITGIVFLAIEVRQNDATLERGNQINRAAVLTDFMGSLGEFRYAIAQDEDITDLWYRGREDEELSPIEALRFEDLCRNYFWILATIHERFILLGEESVVESGPVALIRVEMQASKRLRDCWLSNIEAAADWGFETIANALAEDESVE